MGGQPPLFGGQGMFIHDVVRQEMLTIYREGDYRITVGDRKANFADTTGRNLFDERRRCFHNNNLALECFIQQGLHIYILPWLGDETVNTLSALLFQRGFKAGSFAGVVEVEKLRSRRLNRRYPAHFWKVCLPNPVLPKASLKSASKNMMSIYQRRC